MGDLLKAVYSSCSGPFGLKSATSGGHWRTNRMHRLRIVSLGYEE